MQNEEKFAELLKRYTGATSESLLAVLCPLLIPINTLDKAIHRLPGQKHYRASFSVKITEENKIVLQRGRTGKFVPESYLSGGSWSEIAKGRIIDIDTNKNIANGEIYVGSNKKNLECALRNLDKTAYLEIDQFGASAKVLSGLAEYMLVERAQAEGYSVIRMPEDTARHLGIYYNYDFEFEKDGISRKIEVKSIWGTDTRYARLIHSSGPDYPTSSCKFETQDIFAVSLFLRTGNIKDFAFARSVPSDIKPYGLPRAEKYPEHVNQNPICTIGDGIWFETINEV
jgi:hypothetical protein